MKNLIVFFVSTFVASFFLGCSNDIVCPNEHLVDTLYLMDTISYHERTIQREAVIYKIDKFVYEYQRRWIYYACDKQDSGSFVGYHNRYRVGDTVMINIEPLEVDTTIK